MKENRSVIIWLLSGCVLIFIMVIIGGITRLTHSGLSMVNWNLIMGTIPPLNEVEWQETFELYKTSPEYLKINSHFTLDDFKSIFFWEYLHRMMGRLLGIVFLIPFFYFLIKKKLSRKLTIQSCALLIMGASQGVIGWWMVKSGLVDRPDVSHFRLAVHLITAFLTCSYALWIALSLILPLERNGNKSIFYHLVALIVLVVIQIIYGAFVAGLKAGRIYNTWPKMGEQWIPESVFLDPGAESQFIHRTLALIIVAFTFYIWKKGKKIELSKLQNQALNILPAIVSLQTILGILTLIMIVPISLALTHQIVAFFLLMSVVFSLFVFKKS
jgi:cytochrome c oxidase assembly protein subunit 15